MNKNIKKNNKSNKAKKQPVKKIIKKAKKNDVFLKKFKKGAKDMRGIAGSSFDASKQAFQKTKKTALDVGGQINNKVIKRVNFKILALTILVLGSYAVLIWIIVVILKNGYDMKDVKRVERQVGTKAQEKIAAVTSKDKPVIKVNPNEKEPFDFEKVDLEKIEFQKKVPILMYHYIEPLDRSQSRLRINLTVSPEKFEEQMKYLKDNGFTTMTMTEYFSHIAQNQELPAKPVMVTVDDGYRNFYLNAAPILNKYEQKATTFLISGSMGYPAYMSWDMVRELYKQGFEFGSHSVSHANLKSLKDSALEAELVDSKWVIEKEIGGAVNFMCYPSGFYSQHVMDFTRNAGYKGAVTTASGMDVNNKNLFEMYRYRITDDMGMERFAYTVGQAYQ